MTAGAQPIYHLIDLGLSDSATSVWIVDRFGMRLQSIADGPLGLNSPDGSLGRRLLPRGFAIDPELRCYFVDPTSGIIWRYDSSELLRDPLKPFQPIIDFATSQPKFGPHDDACAWSLAANRDHLIVISPRCREVISFSLVHSAISHRRAFRARQWPVDVVATADHAYLLTNKAVYKWNACEDAWQRYADQLPKAAGNLTRLLIDRYERLWAYDGQATFYRAVSTSRGRKWQEASLDRSLFEVPPVYALHTLETQPKQFFIPAELTCACHRDFPKFPDYLPYELRFASAGDTKSSDLTAGFLIEQTGRRVMTMPAHLPRKQSLMRGGANEAGDFWISPPVDSQLYACMWDIVELQMFELPHATRVEVATYTTDAEGPVAAPKFDSSLWDVGVVVDSTAAIKRDNDYTVEFPVHSPPGRYLFLRIRVSGDGYHTPLVSRILCRAPRHSYSDYLPAVMREDNASRDFLDRFLAVFQVSWDSLDNTIDNMDHLFDAHKAPARQLTRLAQGLGLPLRTEWDEAQRRNFLQAAGDLLIAKEQPELALSAGSARGTASHMKHYLQAMLSAATGRSIADLQGFPWIIEGFRRRGMHPLAGRCSMPADASPDTNATACSLRLNSVATATPSLPVDQSRERLRLGSGSRLGDQRLGAPVSKQLDPYASHAHRFEVVVPAAWLAERRTRLALENAVESEKPAHTVGVVTLIQPGVCIGLQSTLGIDTILADRPEPVLGQSTSAYLGLGQGLTLPSHEPAPPAMQLDSYLNNQRL